MPAATGPGTRSSGTPERSASRTNRPTRPWLSRNGTPASTRRSARSVASSEASSAAPIRSASTLSAATAPVAAGSTSARVSNPSNSSALSSWRSLLYPAGSPFRVVSNATRSPSSRPDFARASSKISGLRFCGSRLEPVLKSSDSRTKPNSALVYNTISAARRERWMPTRVRANKTSATKSRSPVASRAFAETERKPSASFRSTRSTANPDPARAPDPSGSSATRRRASARRWRSRTSGHACAPERGEVRVELVDRPQGPEPQVGGHLVVARPASVQLAGYGTVLRIQQSLHQGVHVLVRGTHGGTIGEPLRHTVEALEQLGLLAGGEHSDPAEGVDPGLARGDVLGPEPVVHRQAAIQRVERFTGAEAEAAAPHLVRRRGRRSRGRRGGRGRLRWLARHHSAAAPTSCWRRAASRPDPIRIERP